MGRRVATWLLVAVGAFGCATTQYENERDPAAGRTQLLSDTTECDRTNMRMLDTRGDLYRYPVMVVDPQGSAQCLAERGWRPVPHRRS